MRELFRSDTDEFVANDPSEDGGRQPESDDALARPEENPGADALMRKGADQGPGSPPGVALDGVTSDRCNTGQGHTVDNRVGHGKQTAARLTLQVPDARGKVERFFHYVRDDIRFGFPPDGDLTAASETTRLGFGQCNTKGTLFLALCKAAGIPARLHFSLIDKKIQRGLFHGLAYRLLPDRLSHAWLEVEIDGTWRRIDGYINDAPFFHAALDELRPRGWDTGFSIAGAGSPASIAFAPSKAHSYRWMPWSTTPASGMNPLPTIAARLTAVAPACSAGRCIGC